ncbi:pectin lyase fold/virulence factor [Vibrio phage 2.275.O._10N.286.54.E11]|nr:pectin lyase fold/virulence factor [Vibrio phage 2.275.O._10N.286.54.E11]
MTTKVNFRNTEGLLPEASLSNSSVISTGSTDSRTLEDRFSDVVNVKDFGAVGDGVTDDTAAIQATFEYVSNIHGTSRPTSIYFPSGTYNFTTITINDLYDMTINFNGALLKANSEVVLSHAIRFQNYNNIKLLNLGALYTTRRANYTYGIRFAAGPGGSIDPTNGLGKEMAMTSGTILRFARGIDVGTDTIEVNMGQNSFTNVHIKECGLGLASRGSQTIVSFAGGSTGGAEHSDFNLPERDIAGVAAYGGVVALSSSEILKTSGAGRGIIISNCDNPTYGNTYGAVLAGNSFIETVKIASIRPDYTTINSFGSSLRIENCSGYSSTASSTIVIGDADYEGTISLKNSNIYSSEGVTHTQPAIDSSIAPKCRIELDEYFFNKRHYTGSRFAQVLGGVVALNNEEYFKAESLGGTSIAPSGSNLHFQNTYGSTRYSRNRTDWNSTTGVYTVPSYGISRLEINLNVGSPTDLDGTVQVIVNGSSKYTFYPVNGKINFSCVLSDLEAGDTINFLATPTGTLNFGASALDYLVLSAIL